MKVNNQILQHEVDRINRAIGGDGVFYLKYELPGNRGAVSLERNTVAGVINELPFTGKVSLMRNLEILRQGIELGLRYRR